MLGNFKHAELKIKKFEEVQALYEKIKRSDEDFISIGSAEDERLIKKMNEKGVDSSKVEMIKEQSKEEVKKESKAEVKEESKEEENTKKRKLGIRKKMKSRKRREKKEVDYEILDRKYPIKEWKTECLGTKPQTDQAEHLEEINLNVVIRSNGQKRYLTYFDGQYLSYLIGRSDCCIFNWCLKRFNSSPYAGRGSSKSFEGNGSTDANAEIEVRVRRRDYYGIG
ncbi:hypothetical protein Tco_0859691 [Tanacetum coccineum]|uniref:Uncharacterized protein n=1 Tax=Tanacetum coccineum TaxID=301880 RepID=A0ABQ5BEH6_9ASTR